MSGALRYLDVGGGKESAAVAKALSSLGFARNDWLCLRWEHICKQLRVLRRGRERLNRRFVGLSRPFAVRFSGSQRGRLRYYGIHDNIMRFGRYRLHNLKGEADAEFERLSGSTA